ARQREHAIESVDRQSENGGNTMIRDRDTLNALLDSVERFVRERLVPAEHVVAETAEIPDDIVAGMKELGLFGLTIPEEYGGLGPHDGGRGAGHYGDGPDLAGLPVAL